MTPDEIDKTIEEFIVSKMAESTFSEISGYSFEGIQIQNEPDPSSDTWMLFSIRNNKTDSVEIGKNGIGMRWGNLHINTFTPKENGKRTGAMYAGIFENMFRKTAIEQIMFMEPETSFIISPDWLNHHTVIPYYTTIGEQ